MIAAPAFRVIVCPDLACFIEATRQALTETGASRVIPLLGPAAPLQSFVAGQSGLGHVDYEHAAPCPDSAPSSLWDLASDQGSDDLLVVMGDEAETIPAIAYGLLTGRRVVAWDGADLSMLEGASSMMIAGAATHFGKALLRRVVDWPTVSATHPPLVGLLTGRDAAHLSVIAARLLMLRALQDAGSYQSATQTPGGPGGFEVIAAHGNEIHLGYGDDAVLCGRRTHWPFQPPGTFDCGRACRLDKRVSASDLKAATVFLMSCDGFTPTGGLAPPDVSLLFALLDGPVAAVLAPFRHVQANEPLVTLIEALAHTGAPLGKIAHVLNGRANRTIWPDPSFLVLGDPHVRVAPPASVAPARLMPTARGTVVTLTPSPGARAATVALQGVDGEGPLAVLPLTPATAAAGMMATFAVSAHGAIEVTVFRDRPFDEGPFEFAVVPAAQPDPAVFGRGRAALKRSTLLGHLFGEDDDVRAARAALTNLLDLAAAFPRLIEAVGSQALLSLAIPALGVRLDRLRQAHAASLVERLATKRIWLSQDYADLYAQVRRRDPAHDFSCDSCGARTVTWLYADPVRGHEERHVCLCDRCGIVADQPARAPVTLSCDSIATPKTPQMPVTVALTHCGDTPASVSLVVQLNEWRTSGVTGSDWCVELLLPPHETIHHVARLELAADMPDDIVSVQVFAIDQDLRLYMRGQKIAVSIGPAV